jgi:hypothetical protein
MPESELRIGVVSDAASTDAVAVDARDHLLATARVARTSDTRGGIENAIRAIAEQDGVDPGAVRRVMLDAGHALDDVTTIRDLRRVAVVRIGAPLTLAVAPLATWPAALREAVSAGEIVVGGGSDYDGRAMGALDADAIARFLSALGQRAQAVAISGVFAPVSPEHELAAAEVARRELGGAIHVSLSHEMGSIGLLERENAGVLNAALGDAAKRLAAAARSALVAVGIDAELFFARGDGTLMVLDHALRFPALMIASGPGTTMRGAAHLSGVDDAIVVSVGATASCVGSLVHGIPRERSGPTDVAGVRTSLCLPDVRRVPFGSRRAPAPRRPALASAAAALTHAVEEARAAQPAVPLVVVGPGQRLVSGRLQCDGAVIRPRDGELAHAIGAAVGAASGEFARICPDRPDTRRSALEDVRAMALARAIDAGAHPDTVAVVDVDEAPLTYLVQPAVRIRVRAAGPCW